MAADLEFRIGAELTEIKGALAGLKRDLASVGQAAQQAGGRKAFGGIEQGARGALADVGRLVAAFASLAAVLKTIGAADELTTLNARLKLVTNSTEELRRAQTALFDLSQRTRTDLGQTIQLYSQIANATKDAGVGQETLLGVVETINKAVQLSGASTQAAEAALVQLGQGLASGTLRGEELNSVLEQTPALADAIAKGMGITRGELRKYGEEGRITAQQVITALQNQRAEVDRQFNQLPLTVGQATTQVKNAALQLLGVFNDTGGATAGLASVISDFAKFLSSDEVIGSVVEFAATWSEAFRVIVNDANEALRIMRENTADIVGSGEDVIDILGRAFRELPTNIRAAIQIVTVQAAAMFDKLVSYAQFVKDNFAAIFTGDTQDAAFQRFQRRNAAIDQAREQSIDAAFRERDAQLGAAKAAREKAAAEREAARNFRGSNSLGNFRAQQSDADKRKAEQLRKAELDAREKLAADSAKRELSTLEQLFEDSKIAAQDYYTRREQIELASIDRSIALERERAQAGGAERIKALAEIEILERQKTDVANKAARDRAEFARNLERQLTDARAQQLENEGNTVEAARIRAEAKYRDLIARLQAEGDAAGVALIRKLIGSEIVDAEIQALGQKISTAVADLRSQESLISAQAEAGLLPEITAEQQIQTAREASIQQLERYRQAVLALIAAQQANGGIVPPQLVELLRQTDTEIARVTASTKTLQNQVQQAGKGALTTFFTQLASGAASFGDAVRAAALQFIQSLAQMAAEALAKRAILSLTGPGGLFAGVFHSGGMVGQGGASRFVNPLVFAGAPRYHSGGMVGLKADERPAILQTGEEVLSRTDPRNAANGGGAGNGTRIINVIDPSLVSDYLSSSAGEKTILNVLQRNPGAVRQVLA